MIQAREGGKFRQEVFSEIIHPSSFSRAQIKAKETGMCDDQRDPSMCEMGEDSEMVSNLDILESHAFHTIDV